MSQGIRDLCGAALVIGVVERGNQEMRSSQLGERAAGNRNDSERVYIDNYKCFANFEIQPQAIQLILGGNGTGKTTLFDVLESLRDFLTEGTATYQSFPAGTLTAWDQRRTQTFESGILEATAVPISTGWCSITI